MLIWIIVSYIGFITVKQQEVVQFFFSSSDFCIQWWKGGDPNSEKKWQFCCTVLI